MYKPIRNDSGKMFISDWAEEWLDRDGGFESKVYEVAGYNPIEFHRICDSCLLSEIIVAWKTMIAKSDYAWNDSPK